ncbi:MAG: tRNA pseudouridine(55) synthase TruB [Syntrophales bacterium]|jgi:tRNA pseudouridine55 synthase|nr:tRNA pseudouridine(55) synthase TruB [Syntrophales bacterium]MDY0045224.1 tRNA pseudouridine(55) synthase TruB [Syntrophales bacterium]
MNGVIVVDKSQGMTSFDVVRDVKKALGIKKVGHTGTLDPSATGVLPLCINEATKAVQFLTVADKEYRATMRLGITTDTQDMTGVVTGHSTVRLVRAEVEATAKLFVGSIMQKVPRYSACKYKGKPYYKWTREGVNIEPPVREVNIYDICVEDFSLPYVSLRISCSKGTYIRALCSDLGERLGCGACLSDLRRIRSGKFSEADALRLDHVDDTMRAAVIKEHLISLNDALDEFQAITVGRDVAEKIREGYQPEIEGLKIQYIPLIEKGSTVKIVTENNELIAIAKMLLSSDELPRMSEKEQAVKLMRVFNC